MGSRFRVQGYGRNIWAFETQNPEPWTRNGKIEMNKTDDLRVLGYCKLIQPGVLKKEMPVSEKSIATVVAGREHVQNILSKKEKRMLVIVGPCSIHD